MAYFFSLIRFVPDAARGEFVNIGAIVGDEGNGDDATAEWSVRWISNYRRAKAIDPQGFLPSAKAFSALIDERIGDGDDQLELDTSEAPPTRDWLGALAVDMNNIVQFTEPAPIVAASAEQALDRIFERLVVDPATTTFRFKKKHQAQKATRQAYQANGVPDDAVVQRSKIESRAFDFQFDFAVHNGHAVQLAQCWSFQLPNQDELTEQVKAWAWMVHEIKGNGGRMVGMDDVAVADDLDFAAVYIPPTDTNSPAFGEAKEAFGELGVTAVDFKHANQVGAKAAQLLNPV